MKKLIEGIMEFRRTRRDDVKEVFAKLALGQNPDGLFVACSDSRVAANIFASTDPGDLFVVRNVGNIVPPDGDKGSTVAALEFAVENLKVRHIIVCGHSDCGAMKALAKGMDQRPDDPLGSWLRHANKAWENQDLDSLCKRNVSLQLENLRTHPMVREREEKGEISLHGIWFDIKNADVYYLEKAPMDYVVIDDQEGERILKRLKD